MERKKTGLTIIELLIVLGIIALLVGVLIPALSAVRNMAKETKQKVQFASIDMALSAFKIDNGDYPPSDPYSWLGGTQEAQNYCGAQKLAEALLGRDLLGFHPDSGFRADGTNRWPYRDPLDSSILHPPGQYFLYNPNSSVDMNKRKGSYLELATANAFRLGSSAPNMRDGLFADTSPLAPGTFVLCDVFGTKKISMANGTMVQAGAPILYYKANTNGKQILDIYRMADNDGLVFVKEQADLIERPPAPGELLPRNRLAGTVTFFENYIADPRITARPWPYRPDSYILISAGADGIYGTSDDIRNFGN